MAKKISIDHVTKIEGHARLHIKIDKGKIEDVSLSLFEGARFFEGILFREQCFFKKKSPFFGEIGYF